MNREEAIERMMWLKVWLKGVPHINYDKWMETVDMAIEALSADRPSGEWEFCKDEDGVYGICSVCGNDADFSHYGKPYAYCPSCGAYMGERKEE